MLEIARLVYKDIVGAKWFLLAALPIYALQLASLDAAPPLVLALTMLFAAMFAFGSIGIDEVQSTEMTWRSLPVGRGHIVLARYLTATLGSLLALALHLAISDTGLGLAPLVMLFFLLQSAIALYLPCYFRFGAGRGLMAFAVLALGIIVVLAVVGAAVAGITDSDFTPDRERREAAAAWLETVRAIVAVTLVLAAAALTTGSVALAYRWYAARDC